VTSWELFHRYRHLVDDDKALPLLCPNDGTRLVTQIGPGDEPVLQCFGCLTVIHPGLDMIQQIRAVVTEHYI
jgi:hypothetical protein